MAKKKAAEETADTGKKVYTSEEVAAHDQEEDCWIIIHGKVYDVTAFLSEHPGGPEIIVNDAGGDSTENFEDTGHSADAYKDLEKYYIGDLKGGANKQKAAVSGGNSEQNPMIILAVIVAIAAIVFFLTQ